VPRLKVLFLASRDWYDPATTGGDMTMWENARYLVSAGHDVTFVCSKYVGARRNEIIDGIKVVRLGGLRSMWLLSFLYYLFRGGRSYDVVVTEGFGGSRIPRLVPLYARQPIITEWHQIHRELFATQYPALLNGPLNLLERITAWVHRNTHIRAGTEEWRTAFPKIGFKPENLFIVPISIRDEWLSNQNGHGASEPTILWLGKLRRYKRPDHIVRAMPEVIRRVPAARLTIAGRHDDLGYERELHELAQKLGVDDHVDFRFGLSDAEKLELFRSARLLALPSSVEGFGIVAIEANACGIPVVASSGVPEGAVRDDFNGLRYRFGDIQALGSAIVRLLDDPVLYARLSTNSTSNAQRYRWSRVGAEFESVVVQLAGQR